MEEELQTGAGCCLTICRRRLRYGGAWTLFPGSYGRCSLHVKRLLLLQGCFVVRWRIENGGFRRGIEIDVPSMYGRDSQGGTRRGR